MYIYIYRKQIIWSNNNNNNNNNNKNLGYDILPHI